MPQTNFELPIRPDAQGIFPFMQEVPDFDRQVARRVNKIAAMEIRFVGTLSGPAASGGGLRLQESGENFVFPLPQCPASIGDPTGGATVDTQARAQLSALLATLRQAGYLPS